MTESAPLPIRPAATVVLLRDASPQYEIFMLKRTSKAVFAGGMHVFPGGAVDEDDAATRYLDVISPPSADQAGQTAAAGSNWLAFWLAGIRETFEESGYLLAYNAEGEMLAYTADNDQRFEDYRAALNKGETSMYDICRAENLTLALDRIHFYNRLITPPGRPRRFDTHFFVTHVPASQTGLHDGTETVGSLWISPGEALEKERNDEFGMMSATQRQLTVFDQHSTADDFIEEAATKVVFPTYANSRVPDPD